MTVLFAIVFAHVVEVTPINKRQSGIIFMEMAIYISELYLLPFGFIIDKYGLTGIKYLSWTLCICQFFAVVAFALTYRNDTYSDEARTVKENFLGLFSGMGNVWFTREPALFVIPLAISFFFMFMSYAGSFSILFNYSQGPPISMDSGDYSLLLGVRGFMSIFSTMALLIVQERL